MRVDAIKELRDLARRLSDLARLYMPSRDGQRYISRTLVVEEAIAKLEKLEAQYKEAKL